MRVVNIHGPGDVRLDKYQPTQVGDHDVVIKVKACGVCGSDLNYIKLGGLRGDEVTPLGHEASGEIVQVGAAVQGLDVGQSVVLNPMGGSTVIGNGGSEGAFTEELLVRNAKLGENLLPLPKGLPFDIAALTEPLAVALHSVNKAKLQLGEKVAVYGCGPIGLGIIFWLVQQGFSDVVAIDIAASRLERAKDLGAKYCIDPLNESVRDKLIEYHGTGTVLGMDMAGTDVFMEAAGAASIIADTINLSKMGARMVVTAIHFAPIELNLTSMLLREFGICTSMGYPTEMQDVLLQLPEIQSKAASLISHRFNFDDVLDAITTAATPDSAKVMVLF